jgi:hypothetical protein
MNGFTSARKCSDCGQWYASGGPVLLSCGVLHPPGDCCHLGETKINPPTEAK